MIGWVLVLHGCGDPFANDPPRLATINGLAVDGPPSAVPDPAWIATVGEDFSVELTWSDPEGDEVRVWFPDAPPGWNFAPDAVRGVWSDPQPGPLDTGLITDPGGDGLATIHQTILLEDQHPTDPRTETVWVRFGLRWGR